MVTKTKIAIGVGVLLFAGLAYAKTRKAKMNCSNLGPQWHFVPADASSEAYINGSAAFRARILKYGGYCSSPGNVTYANGTTDDGLSGSEPTYSEPEKDDLDSKWIDVVVPPDLGVI